MLKGHCSGMDPITQLHKVERAPFLEESPRGGVRECPHDARQKWAISCPTNVADQGNTISDGWLLKTMKGGPNHPGQRRCRSQVSPAIEAPPPATPGRGGAFPSRHWGGRWPPTPADANITPTAAATQRLRALSPTHLRLDRVTH